MASKAMGVNDKNITYKIYAIVILVLFMALAVVVKLTTIQWTEGDYYRKLAAERTVKTQIIPANRGNVYSSDGSLLATSLPTYNIRFDAISPTKENFDKNLDGLADSLSVLLKEPKSHFMNELTLARNNKNRYLLLAKGLSYSQYLRIKTFPLFNLGVYKGGMITEQGVERVHPIGLIAERTIGYERYNEKGELEGKGLEWSYRDFINGKDGKHLMQRIAKGQWKPISDDNEVEPKDGYDIVSTIDVYIQDIAHHALLDALQNYDAHHGCVVVMETSTGEIKAISNLGKNKKGEYVETENYAVRETQEPGSTFKTVGMMALLDQNLADTSTVYNTYGGQIIMKNKIIKDSKKTDETLITLARGLELSANTVIVQAIYNNYKDNPSQYTNFIESLKLDEPLGLQLKGEGKPFVPKPKTKHWTPTTLPWMAFGYNLSLTPLQTLTFYNAIANDGVMVKPFFVKEIKEWDKVVMKYDTEVMNPKICEPETIKKLKAVLQNVVKKGTASALYSKNFSMAGKTGTVQVDYFRKNAQMYHASSFAGFFPVDNPMYSCIVVVNKPNAKNGISGADVAGPVFKKIAQKIFTDSPLSNQIILNGKINKKTSSSFHSYTKSLNNKTNVMPDLKGWSAMDAIALLENMKLKVRISGNGKVAKQSIEAGTRVNPKTLIFLELS